MCREMLENETPLRALEPGQEVRVTGELVEPLGGHRAEQPPGPSLAQHRSLLGTTEKPI